MIGRKEFGTPKNPAVLEDPPTSIDKDMADLLCYPSGIAVPSPVVQRWSLIPEKSAILRLLDFAKFRRKELLSFLVLETWGPPHIS